MSNVRASKVTSVKATKELITAEQFASANSELRAAGTNAKASIKTAVIYVMQQLNYKDQQAAQNTLASSYIAIKKSIGDKAVQKQAATKWIRTQAKVINPDYKWLRSESTEAQKKAKQRKARQAKVEAEAKPAKAEPKKEVTSIAQFRNAIVEKELNLQKEFRGVIPAGKVKEFDQAFAAFIQTLEMILK